VEAYPEYGMRHLSAESALYARVYSEGLLGIEPLGINKFQITPNIPDNWDFVELKRIQILRSNIDIDVQRDGDKLQIKIVRNGELIQNIETTNGESHIVEWK
jgi:cellobiose phosphorylase